MRKTHQKIANRTTIIFCLVLFFKTIAYSQTIDEIKRVDTIYIYFDKAEKYTSKEPVLTTEKSVFYENYITYRFNPDPSNTISFASNTYKNRDNISTGIKNDVIIEKKSFLRKKKSVILDIDFFHKNGFKETYLAIYKKTIYLIDKDEIKGRKIKVKEVDLRNYTYHEL